MLTSNMINLLRHTKNPKATTKENWRSYWWKTKRLLNRLKKSTDLNMRNYKRIILDSSMIWKEMEKNSMLLWNSKLYPLITLGVSKSMRKNYWKEEMISVLIWKTFRRSLILWMKSMRNSREKKKLWARNLRTVKKFSLSLLKNRNSSIERYWIATQDL